MTSWKKNALINMAGRATTPLFTLIFLPLYLRILGIEAFSLVAFFSALLSMTYVLDFTFGAVMTREMARYSVNPTSADEAGDAARSVEVFYLFASVLLGVVAILGAPWISRVWLHIQSLPLGMVERTVAMMGVCVALQAPVALYNGGLYGLERQMAINTAQVALGIIRNLGALAALLWIAADTIAYFGWQIIFGFLQLFWLRTLFWRAMPATARRPRASFAALAGLRRFTLGMTATGVVTFFVSQANSIFVSKLLPISQLGIFQIGNQVNNGGRLLPSPIEAVILPRMSILLAQGDEAAFRGLYHEACQAVALVLLPVCSIIIFFADTLIGLWIGDKSIAHAAAPVASLLLLGTALNGMLRIPYQATLAKGWSLFGFYQNICSVFFFLPPLVILTQRYGLVGTAVVWPLLNGTMLIVAAPILHARILKGEYWKWLSTDVLLPLAVSLGSSFLFWFAMPQTASNLEKLLFIATDYLMTVSICAVLMPHTRAVMRKFLHV
jgi:O-antigen/teichoic acid export membrane protein